MNKKRIECVMENADHSPSTIQGWIQLLISHTDSINILSPYYFPEELHTGIINKTRTLPSRSSHSGLNFLLPKYMSQ